MTIAELAAKYEQYVIDMRRSSMRTGASHHEERTVRRIREELDKLGLRVSYKEGHAAITLRYPE